MGKDFIIKQLGKLPDSEKIVEDIFEIEKEAFPYDGWSEKSIAETIGNNDYICLGVFDDNADNIINGYLFLKKSFEECELVKIAINQAKQNRGLGHILLKNGIDMSLTNNCNKIFLEVRQSNQKAIKLYKKTGFMEIGKRKRFYHSPIEDAVIMMFDNEKE